MNESWQVLVIDDEPVVCDGIALVLRHEGLTVATATTAEEGLAHPALETCRLVLCDVMLPHRSGFEVMAAIHRRRPRLPVMLMTGYATRENVARALDAGAAKLLEKPFDDTELLTEVRSALSMAEAVHEEKRS